MLYAAIGLGLVIVALGVLTLAWRSQGKMSGDYVAPNVLTRINNDYNDTRH